MKLIKNNTQKANHKNLKKSMNKSFIFIIFALFISSKCAITGCKSTTETTCTACNDGYLLVNDGKACFLGCKKESSTKGECEACNTNYKLTADSTACLYGCGTEGTLEAAGTCATCSEGYVITTAKTCIKGCATADDASNSKKCKTCTTAANLSTDALSCIANCKTTGINSEVCAECETDYTLSSDKTSCTKENKNDDKNGSFGLHNSLLIFAFAFLF